MTNLRSRIKLIATLVLVMALVVIAVLNLRDRIRSRGMPSDGVHWEDTANGIEAKSFLDADSPSPLSLWLKPGDTVEYVFYHGKYEKVNHAETLSRYLGALGEGAQARYTIRHEDDALEHIYHIDKPLYDYTFQVEAAPKDLSVGLYLALIGFVYLVIGLFVLFKQTRAELTYHFFAWFAASFVFYFYTATGEFNGLDKLVDFFHKGALALLPALFLHFCLRFPSRINLKGWVRWLAGSLYLPAAFVIATEAIYHYFPSRLASGRLVGVRTFADIAELALVAAYFSAGSALLVASFIRARTPILRQQLKWIIWGLGLSELPFVVGYVIPFVSKIDIPPILQSAACAPLILIPLSFGYSIVRYRLMDVDVIVRRSFVHMLAIIAIGAIYMAMLLGVSDLVKFIWATADLNSWGARAVVVAGMLIVAYLFTPMKNQMQLWADRWFYGERYNLRTGLNDFGRMLAQTTALPDLLDAIVLRLSEVFSVPKVAIFIEAPDSPSGFRLAHSIDPGHALAAGGAVLPERLTEIIRVKAMGRGFISAEDIEEYLAQHPRNEYEPALLSVGALLPEPGRLTSMKTTRELGSDELGSVYQFPREAVGDYDNNGLHYYVPCVVRDRMVAVIGLSRASTGALLSSEDTDLLRALSGYLAVAIDNSLLYRSEIDKAAELARLKDFSENIIESVSVGIMVVDLDGRVTTWNSAIEKMLGIPREDALGENISAVVDRDLIDTIKRITGQNDWNINCLRQIYKYGLIARNGSPLTLNISVAPFEAAHGVVAGTLLVIENVTERALLEQQLQQKEKLSSIGLLAAGVAHEVNTPLAGISSYSQMLLQQVPDDDPRRQLLEKIHAQTLRASGIVSNLLNFSRTGDTQFREIDVNKVLEDTLQLLEPQLRNSRVEILRNYSIDLLPGYGSGSKLQQVFMNLILNSRDAMPVGGRLVIQTRLVETSLVIEFKDTGIGIEPENIARIYDPFFTTKEIGRGTGLGLALSYGIIQDHGGRIFVESRPGEGAHFTIKLPTAVARQAQVASD
jgi:two-component system NtrC family sensor kinase